MVKSATQDVRYSWCFNARDNFSNITTYWSHSTCRCCLCISTSSMFCAYVNCPFHPVQTYGFALLSITRVQIGITSSSSVSCDTGSKNTWREDERRLEKLMKKKQRTTWPQKCLHFHIKQDFGAMLILLLMLTESFDHMRSCYNLLLVSRPQNEKKVNISSSLDWIEEAGCSQ